MSRKRIPLNQNGCTANFRIGVPFEQNLQKEEGRKLTAKKKQFYGEYQKARWDMQEIVTIKANIDTLMGYTEPGRKQEKER